MKKFPVLLVLQTVALFMGCGLTDDPAKGHPTYFDFKAFSPHDNYQYVLIGGYGGGMFDTAFVRDSADVSLRIDSLSFGKDTVWFREILSGIRHVYRKRDSTLIQDSAIGSTIAVAAFTAENNISYLYVNKLDTGYCCFTFSRNFFPSSEQFSDSDKSNISLRVRADSVPLFNNPLFDSPPALGYYDIRSGILGYAYFIDVRGATGYHLRLSKINADTVILHNPNPF